MNDYFELQQKVDELAAAVETKLAQQQRGAERWERGYYSDGRSRSDVEYENRFLRQNLGIQPVQVIDINLENQRIERLAAEYEQLSRNPSANIGRMQETQREIDGLLSKVKNALAASQAARLQSQQDERGKLNRDIEALAVTIERLNVNPSANNEALSRAHSELDARMKKLEVLDADPVNSLEWRTE